MASLPENVQGDLLGEFANLPTAFKSAGKEVLSKEEYLARLDGLKQYSIKQLQEAAQFVSHLNRVQLKAEKRVTLAMAILGSVYPVMARYYQSFQSSANSLPETTDRRQVIVAGVELVEQAAIACKHVFRELYSPKSSAYRRQREQLQETGVRILELLRLEQRWRALRHQKLPANAWKDTNRVFFSLLAHDDVQEKVALLGDIGTWRRTNTDKRAAPSASPLALYFSIQLFGLVDTPSWSTRLFHAPDAYLETVDNAMQLQADHNELIQPGWLLTGIDHGGPALFNRDTRLLAPRILIEYSNLYNRMVMDYEELAKMKFIGNVDASKVSKPLLSLEPMERLPFLESMLFGLRPRERRQKRHAAFGSESLRMYFSFREAFRLLMDLASPDVRRVADSRAFIDTLASHSAGINDSSGYDQTRWEIANFSTGGILVVTRESSYTTPIQVGQIAAFISGKESKRPLIGYVTRIHRPSDQSIEVAVVRLSSHAESALIVSEAGKYANQRLGVILFQNMEGRWSVIAKHDYDLVSGTPLRLVRENNKPLPARLGNVLLTRQEFVVFELSTPGM